MSTSHICTYCGLSFSGPGYSPDGKQRYCCYGCHLVERIMGAKGEEGIAAAILLRLGVGAFLSMNVMMISLILYVNTTAELGQSIVDKMRWALFILSTPSLIILASPFILSGIKDLRRKRIGTDALIATGSLAAYIVSSFHVFKGSGHVYFDTATMLLLIVTLGRLLEASAKIKTSRSIRELIELVPETARVLRDGKEVEMASKDVQVGDMMVAKPGERIPADGCIVSGSCMIEESAFTGEARPRSCSVGDSVYGGSINCDGLIKVEAVAVGSNSLLAQIQEMVKTAQQNRAPIEQLAERVAGISVPIVWLIAACAAIYWAVFRGDFETAGLSALAVLVVSCPCALGLATPMAICLAVGKAAGAGVLIRSGGILERLSRIRKIFFDKTGTLTENRLAVAEISVAPNTISADETLTWAAPLESASEHAIARAIVAEAENRNLSSGQLVDFTVIPGRGVEGSVVLKGETRRITAGSLKLLLKKHEIPNDFPNTDESLTTIYIGWDSKIQASITLSDTLRPEAHEVIAKLHLSGIHTAVISGDLDSPTRRLAAELNINEVFSERTPVEKVESIKNAKCSIAMVGDGINDAPALAEAYVGIAIGGGTDLARQASDITLLGDDLTRIPWVLELSKSTHKIIRQNLFWAFGYNFIAITLAFFGFVHPLIAATAMFISSLFVIANSMRILR